jgi:hypothetical protein
MRHSLSLAFGAALTVASSSLAAFINNGDIVVQRVGGTSTGGSGASALSSSAAAVFIDVYRNSGATWSRVNTVALSTSGTDALTASGSATSEGFINLSADRQSITAFGYNVASGTATAKNATTRTLATIGLDTGSVSTKTGAWGASGNNARSAVSTGSGFYYTCDSGLFYVGNGSTSATTVLSGNVRCAGVAITAGGNSLFASSGVANVVGTTAGIGQIGTGMPTGTAAASFVFAGAGTSPYQFSMLDTDGNGVVDLAYAADSSAGLSKYVLVGGSWVSKGTIAGGLSGVSAYISGSSVILAVTNSTGTTLSTLTDASFGGSITGLSYSTVATAATNTAFRGVVAVPAPGAAALVGVAGLITTRRRKA